MVIVRQRFGYIAEVCVKKQIVYIQLIEEYNTIAAVLFAETDFKTVKSKKLSGHSKTADLFTVVRYRKALFRIIDNDFQIMGSPFQTAYFTFIIKQLFIPHGNL